MNWQKITLFLLLLSPVPFVIGMFNNTNIGAGALWDAISFAIVIVGAILLFLMTFNDTSKSSISFFLYKLIWLQELFILSGIIGTMIGFSLMLEGFEIGSFENVSYYSPQTDPTSILMGSMAIALITIVYGFLGALFVYLVQKYYEMKNDQIKNIEIKKPKEGFLLTSFFYSALFFVIYTLGVYFGTKSAGMTLLVMFSVNYIIPPIILIIIFILFYKGNSFINLIKNLFWYLPDTKKNIEYNLNYIRNMKKIASMFISVSFLCAPIVMLASMTWGGYSYSNILGWNSIPFIGIKNGGFLFLYIMDLIVILTIIEGREVSKLYFETGMISSGDRFYSLKYVIAPSFLLFLTFSFGIMLTFIVL